MSTNDDDMMRHAENYRKEVKRLREKNAQIKEDWKTWEAEKGPKPDREHMQEIIGGTLKSEAEISSEAKKTADRKHDEQVKMRKLGLVDQPKTKRDKLIEKLGMEAVLKAEAKARERHESREKDKARGLDRERDDEGRNRKK